jgi:hypothetical protein
MRAFAALQIIITIVMRQFPRMHGNEARSVVAMK